MKTETIIGFDSAWANKIPGAICSVTHRQGNLVAFKAPQLVHFEQAAEVVEDAARSSDFTLVAIDQPTLVPNSGGMRPVERVAASIVNRIGGRVQPAFRNKVSMFGDEAPIWRFLDWIGARENPPIAKTVSNGLFLVEVFPALALPSIIPAIWHRRCAARYNPARKGFTLDDWQLVARGVAEFAGLIGIPPIVTATRELALLSQPNKQRQDQLDSLICLTIAWAWRHSPRKDSMVIGDNTTGYMVTPITSHTAPVLIEAASRLHVPVDDAWNADAHRSANKQNWSDSERHKNTPSRKRSEQVPVRNTASGSVKKSCPECGHEFQGNGWGGIDAHWRANHENIMPYELAWPIIRKGGKP